MSNDDKLPMAVKYGPAGTAKSVLRRTPPDTQQVLTEIAAMAIRLSSRNDILGEDRAAAKALGQMANDVAGLRGMRVVYHAINRVWEAGLIKEQRLSPKYGETFHPASFQAAWDGIGDWRW